MGKIRVKVLGDEEKEKEQKEKARKEREAKIAQQKAEGAKVTEQETTAEATSETTSIEGKAKKKEKFSAKKTASHSKKYQSVTQLVDKSKVYKLSEALSILPKLKLAKFDETVELHMNTTDTGISGAVTLPHGTGKKMRIAVVNATKDPSSADEIVKKVEGGQIDFDVLIATPDSMPKLARIAKFLGPRGLMPNPKNGTVTPKPEEVAKKFEGGQVNFKTEAKFPIMHVSVGKLSFGEQKLEENIEVMIQAIQTKNIKNVTLKSTMSPGLKIDISSLS